MPSTDTQLDLTIDDEAVAYVRERGSVLTIRTRPRHGCCGGRVDRATVGPGRPADPEAGGRIGTVLRSMSTAASPRSGTRRCTWASTGCGSGGRSTWRPRHRCDSLISSVELDASMDTVLFVCTHNSSRSQMAEGLLRDRYGDRYQVRSAGTTPGGVHPVAMAVMEEVGIDISDHTSEHAYAETPLDVVVAVCDDAAENCPYIPARKQNLHQGFDDPSAVEGPDDEKRAAFRRVRDELADWIDATFGPEGSLASE